ncbi:MAG: hypothetical protein ACK50J_00555, partial [Planctomyces sp.]
MSIAYRHRAAGQIVSPRRLSAQDLAQAQRILAAGSPLQMFADEFGFSTELQALQAIGSSIGMPVIDLSKETLDKTILEGFPVRLIHRHGVFPVQRTESSLKIVLSNPFDVRAADAVSAATGLFVSTALA